MNLKRSLLIVYLPLRAIGAACWAVGALARSGALILHDWIEGEQDKPERSVISHQWTFAVGQELGRLTVLVVDDTANDAEMLQIALTGFKAMRDLAKTPIHGPLRERVYAHIAEGFLHELTRTVLSLPDEELDGPRA